MTYVCWAARYEGVTDKAYFDVLLPRIMEELTLEKGIISSTIPPAPAVQVRGDNEQAARDACDASEAFHIIFVHSDAGGRNLQAGVNARACAICEAMNRLCGWRADRCVVLLPQKETEAWVLADARAVCHALGYSSRPEDIGLPTNPANVHQLDDPKEILASAVRNVRGARRAANIHQLFSAVAQRQSLEELRKVRAYMEFEERLAAALKSLGCIA